MAHPLAYMVAAAVGVIAAVYLVFNSRNENQQHSHSRRDRSRHNGTDHPIPSSRSWYEDDDENDKDTRPQRKQKKSARSPGCAICMETFTDLVNGGRNLCSLPCGHIFCEKCIKASLQRNQTCPKCRQEASVADLHYAYL